MWVAIGFLMLFTMFLPTKVMLIASLALIFVAIIVPIAYSVRMYKNDIKKGKEYSEYKVGESMKKVRNISIVIVVLILIGCAILMFMGDLKYTVDESGFDVDATFYNDLRVNFDEIDTIEYREDVEVGMRTFGYGSARLLMGNFKNDEFGAYTRYSYVASKSGIVIRSGERVLVISAEDVDKTEALYENLLEKINK